MRTILITGSSGFIGSYLAQRLLDENYKVYGLSRQNNQKLKGTNYLWISADLLSNRLDLPKEIDCCIHAAALSPDLGLKTYDFVSHNIIATHNLLSTLEKTNCKHIIFLSGVSVYGNVMEPIINEKTLIRNPDPYGLSKLLAEYVLKDQESIPVCILRLPGVLGKGAYTPWLVRQIRKAIRNEKIKVYNPDAPFNNAVWVDDLCDFIITILCRPLEDHQMFLLGAKSNQAVNSIINQILIQTGSKSKVEEITGTTSFALNISKAIGAEYAPQTVKSMLSRQIEHELSVER